ncbi:MAG: ABC transporter ATP-binding protein [Gammaproteobacteria bacterium]|nr:ABC transporter ATP-binding protein [Gammaproteobacteria bacterium]
MSIDPILQLDRVKFGWDPQHNLINIDSFSILPGESVFLRGPSGSGKSTLLGLIGGVIVPESGRILVNQEDIVSQTPSRRDRLRADLMGVIFQQFNLLPYLSVLDNITLPCLFSAERRKRSRRSFDSPMREAEELIKRLGLQSEVFGAPVNKLSVGQQQRVAVARALIGGPSLIIADEPTSALDAENRDRFIELLNEQRQAFGTSLLFVSHDPGLAGHFNRVEEFNVLNTAVTADHAA